jgi:type VI secretion system secreted protein VgrG
MGAVNIISIEDARPLMFRLGTGGISPNPYNVFNWPALPATQYEREEPPITLTAGGVNPFQGADKNIQTLKQWMDAIMTKLKELGGTTYWYEDVSTFSLINTFVSSNATVLQSKGLWTHSCSTPGLTSWSADVDIWILNDPREYVLSGPGSFQLQDGQVAYLDLTRNAQINGTNSPVAFANGAAYVNTISNAIGLFSNLSIGDWIVSVGDPTQDYVQVVQFFNGLNASGATTTAANAKSISISAPYQGATANNIATYDKGVYTSSDIIISNRNAAPLFAAGGNFFWLAYRSDNIETLTNVATTALSISIAPGDGTKALVTTGTANTLADNQRVVISGTTDYNGTYQIEVVDTTHFYIPFTTIEGSTETGTASYAIVTTAAPNGFPTDSKVIVSGTTNYNGSYQITPIDATHFQIPVATSGSIPPGSPNLATASAFGVLASSTITTVNPTTITGYLGLYPGTSVTGSFTATAEFINDSTSQQAETDALAAYNAALALTYTTISPVLDGQTLTAGNYNAGAASLAASGNGTLTFNGSATDIFIIKCTSTLTTGAGGIPTMAFTGGALASNVYWIVQSSATINVGVSSAGATFSGTVIADASITVTQNSIINGRLLALTAAVTFSDHATITVPSGGVTPPETSGTTTLAAVIVRTQQGAFTLYQCQSVPINGTFAQAVPPDFIDANPDYALPPGYNTLNGTENYNGLPSDGIVLRISELTGMMADKAQDKTIKYLPENILLVGNTTAGSAQQITFTSNSTPYLTILQPSSPGNAVITLPTSPAGISLLVNQSAYVYINRNAASTPTWTVVNTNAVPLDENVFVIASRLNDDNIYLWNGSEWGVGETPFAGTGTGITQVNLYDPVDATLQTGSVTIDGVTVTAGMYVLFSALSSGNNEIYVANGTGSTITGWTAQYSFSGNQAPVTGDLIIVTQGTNYANQIGEFNGTTWFFNNTVRYFNGTDYWEQSALITTTLPDATSLYTVYSVAFAGSQNQIVDYSILRGIYKETGTLDITTDGVNVSVTTSGANLNGPSGVTFSAIISGSNLVLQSTTTATGSSTTMKYSVKRWSDSAGGPGGLPSYSGGGGSGVTSINGESGAVTITGTGGTTVTNIGSAFTINSTGGGGPTLITAPAILDNQASPVTLFSYTASGANFAVFNYSIFKGGSYRVGRLLVSNDGIITSESDDYTETGSSGVTLTATYSGGNVNIQYTSTNTGSNGTLKYYLTSWS